VSHVEWARVQRLEVKFGKSRTILLAGAGLGALLGGAYAYSGRDERRLSGRSGEPISLLLGGVLGTALGAVVSVACDPWVRVDTPEFAGPSAR
jgi:uncharacterized protein involved in exopolysaccharide biosynthesis